MKVMRMGTFDEGLVGVRASVLDENRFMGACMVSFQDHRHREREWNFQTIEKPKARGTVT